MALSEEQIKELLQWFVDSSENYSKYGSLRQEAIEVNHKWIQPEAIRELSDEDLEKRFLDYYNSDTGYKQSLNKLNRDRIIRDKAKFRETVYYLLNEEIPIEVRVNEVLRGEYRISGFGRGIMSAFLMDFLPDEYCLWNRKSEMGFEVLGWKIRERGDSPGAEYVRVLSGLKRLRNMRPDLNLTLNDVDFFLHTIAAEDEGKEALRSIAGVQISGLHGIIHEILRKEPKNWALSRDFFHSFYHDHIVGDVNGWTNETIRRVLQKLTDYEKRPGVNLTEGLIEDLSGDSEGISVVRDLIDLVKICDNNAYKQDHSLPVVGRPFLRQHIYYEKILKWKLEARKATFVDDILKSEDLPTILKNVFLFLYDPQKYISSVSPNHRKRFINNLIRSNYTFSDNDSNKACIETNEIIQDYFRKELATQPNLLDQLMSALLDDHFFTRVISHVIYHDSVRSLWDRGVERDEEKRKISYWQIAPGEGARLWEDFLNNSIAAVGWKELNSDLSGNSYEKLLGLYRAVYPQAKKMETKVGVRQLYNFLKIRPGDKIITNKGRSLLLGIGEVKSGYRFLPEREEYRHTIEVDYYKVADHEIPIPDRLKGKFGRTIVPLKKSEFDVLERLFNAVGGPNIWWVNQGATLRAEQEGGFLWAPLKTKDGRSIFHWDTMAELKQDDIVLHYANGSLRCVSKVREPAVKASKPASMKEHAWEEEGRIIKLDYHELKPPISLPAFADTVRELDIIQGPINSTGGVNQGYLFRFTTDALRSVQLSQPETSWPDFVPSPGIQPPPNPEYPLSQCAEETGFPEETLKRWVRAIERKGQAVVYGPPGTGKTYIAERLARHLIGGGDGFQELVQFHPAYAYEDFVQGIRPQALEGGGLDYPVVPGRFLTFCKKAAKKHDRCVLIIDEINRANLARVFGEMMYLLEYRDAEVPLASGGSFQIPANVRMIGTMNTADRSIALVDHALRRRFAFLAMYPDYEILKSYHKQTGFSVDGLAQTLRRLNTQIGDAHYEVGITFFLREDLAEQIEDIWRMEIEPYLEEYFFDQREKVDEFRWDIIQDKIFSS